MSILTIAVDPQLDAKIDISLRDPAKAEAMASAISEALARLAPISDEPHVTITVRTRKSAIDRADVTDAILIIPVTSRSARFLLEITDLLRLSAAPPRGIQLVWDGHDPERTKVERHVFAVLEKARATPHLCPVVLAKTSTPVYALLRIIEDRLSRKESPRC